MTQQDYKTMAKEIMAAAGFPIKPGDESIEIEVVSDETPVKII